MRLVILLALCGFFFFSAKAQIVNIPDANFKNALLTHVPVINTNNDSEIQVSEAVAFTGLMKVTSKNIVDMTGVQAFINMTSLDCQHNPITILPTNGLNGLRELNCSYVSLTSLSLNNLPSLLKFTCDYSSLTLLTITNLPELSQISCHDNQLITLSINNAPKITQIECYRNQLTSFTLTPLIFPVTINCAVNRLTTLPLVNTPRIYNLNCSNNLLTSLPLTNLNSLSYLNCGNNQLSSLTFSNPAVLRSLYCGNNLLTSLPASITSLNVLFCNNNQLTSLPAGMNALTHLDCSNNLITSFSVDNCNSLQILRFANNLCTSFSLSNKPLLNEIICDSNKLSTFSISNMPALTYIECQTNQIDTISLSSFPALRELRCTRNQLKSLQLTNLPALDFIYADYNRLDTLSLSNLPQLATLLINDNRLSALSLSNLPRLFGLSCNNNQLTQLDLSRVPIKSLTCVNNPNLLYINIKNNAITTYIYVTGVNMLEAICVDSAELIYVLSRVDALLPGQNISVSTFCTAAGNYNTIVGTVRFDQNTNGCNNLDSVMNYVKVNITDGVQSGTTFTNNKGIYKFLTQPGPNTVTTDFPNNWFTTSPPAHVINFTGYGNIAVADFCITANGTHPDLDVVLLPINGPQPGYDVIYRLVYSNKGNQTQSGNVNLSFNDTKLNFLSSTPAPSGQLPGNLIWTYTNLSPYQTKMIDIKFYVHAPPIVNNGDILSFVATVNPVSGDETPVDNVFNLNQVVANSWDPNDKQVMEGSQITIEKAKDFLHYLIRFQNIGTASAINIVIKDSLADNLDWNSFVPVTASHTYRTVVTKGNKIEFIFDGINLPGKNTNEPTSHGFVAFKIKPKSTIAVGETIYNKAEIYFDFNQPIITNTVSTTIVTPKKSDNLIDLSVYSNPVKDEIRFKVKAGSQIKAINLYNTVGEKLYSETVTMPGTDRKVNITNLPTGMLFLEVITNGGTAVQKVIRLR